MISSTAQYSLTFPPFSCCCFSFLLFFLPFLIQWSLHILQFSSSFFFTLSLIYVVSISSQFSSFISFAWFKFIITMLFLFVRELLNFCLLFFLFSFLPLLFLPPPSSLFLHITVWPFPQFSLSFPGSGAPCSRTLSIPVCQKKKYTISIFNCGKKKSKQSTSTTLRWPKT